MKRKKMFWVSGIVLVCIIGAEVYVKTQGGTSAETMTVAKGEIKQYVEDTALVKCVDTQNVYIDYPGKIADIKYDEGDSVKKGDVLLTLDTGDLELQLKDANTKVDIAKAQLQSTDLVNFANKIEIDKTNVEKAGVANDSASKDLENAKALYAAAALSKDDLDKAQNAFNIADEDLKGANLQLNEDEKGTPEYVKNSYMAQFEQAVNARDIILKNIEKAEVKAPIDGTILEKSVDENSQAAAGTQVFVIGNTQKLELDANILSDDIYKVKIGDEVEIDTKSADNSVIKGKVTKIAPEAKTITSNLGVNETRVPVTINVIDASNLLKPGSNVDIRIITGDEKDRLVVPDSAVFDYQGNTCILAVENNKAVLKKIKKGLESDNLIEVTQGLQEGETILVKPDNNIKEGMKIKTQQNKK